MPDPLALITSDQMLAHWQGHRRLTRRVIEAFPEEELFSFSVGGMRPFGKLVGEMLRMAVPSLEGIVSRTWQDYEAPTPTSKEELLAAWDQGTERIEELWPQIPAGRFQEEDTAFGMWPGPVHYLFLYAVENEIHHRAQGYVYLRALGIEPPAFYER